jgi:hypothetical protein
MLVKYASWWGIDRILQPNGVYRRKPAKIPSRQISIDLATGLYQLRAWNELSLPRQSEDEYMPR